MLDLLFKNADILYSNKIVYDTNLGIKESKIFYIGQTKIKAKKIINLKGKLIIPGLINCHTHAAMNAFRGLADDLPLDMWLKKHIWPAEKKNLSPAFAAKWTKQACLEMTAAGITTFADMYFFEEASSKAAQKIWLRMAAGEAILDFRPDSFLTTENLLDKRLSPLISLFIAPHSTYSLNAQNLKKAKKLADKYQLRFAIHGAETKNEKNDIKYLDRLGVLDQYTIIYHAVWVSDKDIEILAKKNVKVVHCPQSNMKLASGIAPVAKMLQAGIVVALGTDSAASNNTLDMFREMKTAALLAKVNSLDATVLPAKQVFQMATINGAKVLGLEKEIGSIEVGKSADLAIIDFNKPHLRPVYDYFSHLVYAVNPADVAMTLVAGKIIYSKS